MNRGFFITGTDTGVGKTFVAAGLIRAMKDQGINICPFKPAETGCKIRKGKLVPADTNRLMKAAGIDEPVDSINPYRMRNLLAPSVAADIEGIIIKKKNILNAYKKLSHNYDIIIAEGAGGIMVPLYKRYLFLDLIRELDLPLLIIARPGLGTINHSLLTVEAARSKGIKILGMILNHADRRKADLATKTNPEVIAFTGKVHVIGTVPHISHYDKKAENTFNVISSNILKRLVEQES